ncbi:SDR family oxidoreductase [bacterium]|nr:SDR family oxidoreductase [bacterium]
MTLFDFKNKVVLITGGSSGIGGVIVRSFQENEARIVCVDVQSPEHPLTQGRFIAADVSDFDQVRNCVEDVLSREGTIDCLINNAGISRDAVVWKMSEEEWDAVLDVNLKGAFNFIHHLAPHFKEKKGGKIVNISSINGLRGKFGLANYSAAKAGLIGLTKTVAKELGRNNVNVNAVAPGYVITPLTEKLPQEVLDTAKHETVFGRLAEPEDVASAVLFLCSDLARHITGEVLKVDGGQYI